MTSDTDTKGWYFILHFNRVVYGLLLEEILDSQATGFHAYHTMTLVKQPTSNGDSPIDRNTKRKSVRFIS